MIGDRQDGASEPPPPPASLAYEPLNWSRGDRPFSPAAALAGWGSVLAACLQIVAICGSPRLLFFHASDAAPAEGTFTRWDRLWFLLPSVAAVGLGCVALRFDKTYGPAMFGIVLAFLSLVVIHEVGFSQ